MMTKRMFSLLTVMAVVVTFLLAFAMADGNVYAKSKKYPLPKEIRAGLRDDPCQIHDQV